VVRRGVCGAVLAMAALGFVGVGGYNDLAGHQDGMQDVVSAQQDYNDGGYNDVHQDASNEW
jgi:hypothetical protein